MEQKLLHIGASVCDAIMIACPDQLLTKYTAFVGCCGFGAGLEIALPLSDMVKLSTFVAIQKVGRKTAYRLVLVRQFLVRPR